MNTYPNSQYSTSWSEYNSDIHNPNQQQPLILQSEIIQEYINPSFAYLFQKQKTPPQTSQSIENKEDTLEQNSKMMQNLAALFKDLEIRNRQTCLAIEQIHNLSQPKFNQYLQMQCKPGCIDLQQNYYQPNPQSFNIPQNNHICYDQNGIIQQQANIAQDKQDQPVKQINNNYFFSHIIEVLNNNTDRENNLKIAQCIQEISVMCKSKSKIKLKIVPQKNQNQFKDSHQIENDYLVSKLIEEDQILLEQQLIKKQNEDTGRNLNQIMNEELCGLCLDHLNSVQHIESAQEFFNGKYDQFFQAKCSHFMNRICLANSYKQVFDQSRINSEEEYLNKLKKNNKYKEMFICNQCNALLQFQEVQTELKEYIENVRSKRKRIECLICIVDYDLEEESISLSDCDHIFCQTCLLTYVISLVNQNKFKYEDMKCPQEGCNKLINNFIIDSLINNPEHEMLYNRMIRMQIIHMENKKEKFALCPGFQMIDKVTKVKQIVDQETITKLRLGMPPSLPENIELIGCSTFFSYEKNVVEYTCTQCKYRSCLKGCEDYHYKNSARGKNCEEFKKWKVKNQTLDKDILAFFDKNTMCQCPKCQAVIIKNGGCNHITCTMPNCGYQFCFKCQSKWMCWKHLHYF